MSRFLYAISLCIGLSGCGASVSTSNPDAARAALDTVLETWKSGGTTGSLLEKSPAINAGDYRWEAGFKLNSYKISESPTTSGFDRRYSVELSLTNPKGKAAKERAIYNVATSPSLTVVRDPES